MIIIKTNKNIWIFLAISSLFIIINNNNKTIADINDANWSEPENIDLLNSEDDEFAPVYNKYDNRIYFNSDKSGYSYFYFTELYNDNFNTPELLKHSINTPRNNQAYFCPADEKTAYITTFRLNDRRPYQNIFKSIFQKNEWTKATAVNELISDNYLGMPTISPDGQTMIFVSDKDNNSLETDLWQVFRSSDGKWGIPSQIDNLNSTGNEITPYLKSSDTLFFASDGYGGSGGFDIYFSVMQMGKWQRPKPFNFINSEYNESDITFLPDGSIIFASDRPGGTGKLDLYRIKPIKAEISEPFISEYRFSISAQVPQIRVKRTKSNFVMAFLNQINPKPDNTDKIMLSEIAERMKKDKNSDLKINSINQSDDIVNYLKSKGIDESRLYLTNPGVSYQDKISISSDNDSLFLPLELNYYQYKFEPPILEINLDAQPRDAADNWQLSVSYLNTDSTLMESNRLPASLYYKVQRDTTGYLKLDSVKFRFSSVGLIEKSAELNIPIRISEENTHNVIKKDGSLYYQYYALLHKENDINSTAFELFKNYLKRHKTDNIIIYYNNNKYLEKLKKYISGIFGNVNIITMKYEPENIVDSENLYKILIRKIE